MPNLNLPAIRPKSYAWNKGRIVGQKRPLLPKHVWAIRVRLEIAENARDLALFNMATGARVGEVRQARFEHFNLELGSRSKPATTTKQRKIHRLPISEEVAAIVRQRQLIVPNGIPWLFPGDVPGQPVIEIRRFWRSIQKKADLQDVRIHDLRHTFASAPWKLPFGFLTGLPHRAFTRRAIWAASEAGRPSETSRAIRCMRGPA